MTASIGASALYFNPHPRTEGDQGAVLTRQRKRDFNPHPRTEGDATPGKNFPPMHPFQPPPSHGG